MKSKLTAWREQCDKVLSQPVFHDYRTIMWLWLALCVFMVIKHQYENNFLIFCGVWDHLIAELPMYAPYPEEYEDVNHYGPAFSLLIALFAIVPKPLGLFLWLVFLVLFLFAAIRYSDLTKYQRLFVFWFCTHELLNAMFLSQFNIGIAAIVVLTFTMIERRHDFWAAFFIMLGTMTKLYGILGLAFFFFSHQKIKFIISLLFWGVMMFVAPMLFASSEYVVSQYFEWYADLLKKNAENINMLAIGNMADLSTNISLLGFIRRSTRIFTYSDLWIIIPNLILFSLAFLRRDQYKYVAFRKMIMASALMFCVLFSTGSENSTYIIAFVGVAVWYCCVPWQRSCYDKGLMILVFIISSLSPGDLFPKVIYRGFIQPYAIKAVPVAIVWFKLCYELLTCDYSPRNSKGPVHSYSADPDFVGASTFGLDTRGGIGDEFAEFS